MAWMSGKAAAMTTYERIVRNTTTCETRGAFEHANPRCGTSVYVVLVVHVRLMSTRHAAAVRGSCQDIWSSLPSTNQEFQVTQRPAQGGIQLVFRIHRKIAGKPHHQKGRCLCHERDRVRCKAVHANRSADG